MARYIDADLLMKELGITDPYCEKCGWGCKGFPYCKRDGDFVDACDAICEAPTADVRENVHAKWLPYEFGNERWHKCSVCGKADEYINERGIEAVRKFCPNCGAEMRE